jgi:predicted adenylyl cyclase CyaB
MPREVEVKSVIDDVDGARRRIEAAGATLEFEGRLEDLRYDTPDRRLVSRDEVLRVREYHGPTGTRTSLEWKGPTRYENGYKVRDEITTTVAPAAELAAILERLGYRVIGRIDRDVAQYAVDGATVRFERYPRMDALVEVEGPSGAIERAIEALGVPRAGFSAERLWAFVERYERRTGARAAVSHDPLAGDVAGQAREPRGAARGSTHG